MCFGRGSRKEENTGSCGHFSGWAFPSAGVWMCIVFFAYRFFHSTPFLLLDNRDEDFVRPTKALHEWEDFPALVGSRDLERMGTWMAVNQQLKRFAVLTNLRVAQDQAEDEKLKRSRGKAVLEALTNEHPLEEVSGAAQSRRGSVCRVQSGHWRPFRMVPRVRTRLVLRKPPLVRPISRSL